MGMSRQRVMIVALCLTFCSAEPSSPTGEGEIMDGLQPSDTLLDSSWDGESAALDTEGASPGDDATTTPPPAKGLCTALTAPYPERPTPSAATLPFLSVSGTDIVTPEGTPVALRGVNFGSWLMMETWIAGIGLDDEGDLLDALEEQAEQLGIGALLDEAILSTSYEWTLELVSHRTLVDAWREYCAAHALPEEQEAVQALWSWFDEQPWIFEEESLWSWLEGRFGAEKADVLKTTFHDAYITEADVAMVASLGLNLIRVPVWYQNLRTDFADPGNNQYRAEGWQKLHELAEWARTYEVYLMIDLHGAPGGQSTSWHQGMADGGHLWTSEACLDETVRLWEALASYFAGDPHVAIYDLLNEPMHYQDPSVYSLVHTALYEAIRGVDPDHVVMIENGYRPLTLLPSPAELGMDNAMYSIHLYPGGTSAEEYVAAVEEALVTTGAVWETFECPLLLGEFNPADGEGSATWAGDGLEQVLGLLDDHGVHWTLWTWKYKSERMWGVIAPSSGDPVAIDVKDASFETIQESFQGLASSHYAVVEPYGEVLGASAATPAMPLVFPQ